MKSVWSPELQKAIDETREMGKKLLASLEKLRKPSDSIFNKEPAGWVRKPGFWKKGNYSLAYIINIQRWDLRKDDKVIASAYDRKNDALFEIVSDWADTEIKKFENSYPVKKQEPDTMQKVSELHRIKDEMNQAIKNINSVPGLEIQVEILEVKAEGTAPTVVGLEVSVKQEIYP